MSRKKILLITVRADYGGGPKHVDLLLNNISEEFEVYVACPRDKPYFQYWTENPRVQDIFLIPHRKFALSKWWQLADYCRQKGIAVVHSHGKGAGVYSRLLKLLVPQIKVVHTFHGMHIGEYGRLQKKLYFLYEKALALFTNKFINVSEGEKKQCLNFNLFKPDHSVVIYNAISPLQKDLGSRCPALQNKKVVATISRFDYPKNMELAYCIAKSFKNNPNIIFLWVGDGQDKQKLEELAALDNITNILFTGFSDNVVQYLSWADIYLSTSRWEGLPYALMEAGSLGIPIVASNVVGNNEIVIPGKNGFLFDLHAPEAAVNYINVLVNDQEMYAAMSAAAHHTFHKMFRIEAMVAKLESVYED